MSQVAHLHFHSEFSLQDSTIRMDQIAKEAERKGAFAIALTDHGVVDGNIKFYQALEKTSVLPLLGCEFYVVDDLKDRKDKKRYHVVAIAKNREGFTSIMKALTVANLEGFYYRPRIDFNYMIEHLDDVVIMTACTQGIIGTHPRWEELVLDLYEKYGEDFYLEQILLTDFTLQIEANKQIKELSKDLGLKMVFTNDVHYIEKEHWTNREVLMAAKYHRNFKPGEEGGKPGEHTKDLYFKTYEQMVEGLKYFDMEDEEDSMVQTWVEIADKCAFELKPLGVSVPVAYDEAVADPGGYMAKLCWDKFNQREWKDQKVASDRLEHELKEICNLGFAEYFLLVRDMVLNAKERGVMVGTGRGSVGGSFVAYLLEITGVDPLEYDLVFERFISPGRHDLPDIDLDFEDIKRDEVIQYLREKYGDKNVALVSTFSSMKGRGAIRDVGRVYGTSLADVGEMTKQILERSGGDARASFTIEDTVDLFEKSKVFAGKYPHVIKVAAGLEGVRKNKGIHAAGVVVDVEDLYTGHKCVLVRAKNGEIAINWDKKDLEYMGMMKIDALGLKTLNVLHQVQELLSKKEINLDYEKDVDFEDKDVIKAFQEGDCIGIFQFGTAGMIQYLRNFKPVNFKELYQVCALWRPGTLRSGLATKFIILKDNPKKVEYINDKLKAILEETHGIVLFQEQIMFMLNQIGDIPWRTADVIRKVVSKSEGEEKFEAFRKQFLEGVKRLNSMPLADADKIFSLMKFFGSYGFNKCLAANNFISIPSGADHRKAMKRITIKEAYLAKVKEIFIYDSKKKRQRIAFVKEIVYTGKQEVYRLLCETHIRRKKIDATIDHKFLTPTGWKRLGDLKAGDFVLQSFAPNLQDYGEVIDIEKLGFEDTYDIHIDDPEHNYVANNFVVHNSHSVEYTMLSFWTMWAKVKYPLEFYCASLKRAADKDVISALLTEVNRRSIDVDGESKNILVEKPDINKSETNWSVEGERTLRAGFDIIKGVSERLSAEIVKVRKESGGRFESYEKFIELVPKRLCNRAKIKMLALAGAFGDLLTEEEAKQVAAHIIVFEKVPKNRQEMAKAADSAATLDVSITEIFNYELAIDYRRFNERLINILESKYPVVKLESVKEAGSNRTIPDRWYLGRFDNIKYGYRAAVTKGKDYDKKSQVDSRGYADDLGGTYGIFRDDTYLYYATFTQELYHSEKKGQIEDMAGKYIIMKAGKDTASTNLFVKELYLLSDIKAGRFEEGLDLSGVLKPPNSVLEELFDETEGCMACSARAECRAPTPFATGYLPVMVVGEAPGRDEESSGVPFVGAAGRVLWKYLNGKYRLEREMFHITNLQKCRPKNNEFKQQVASKCADRILKKEIDLLKPKVILSLGRWSQRYFAGENAPGITDERMKNNRIVFEEKWNAWVVYNIHPAAVLPGRNESLLPEFHRTLDDFHDLVMRLL